MSTAHFLNWYKKETNQQSIRTLDLHAAGEALRVVTDGWPQLEGETILERRTYQAAHFDHLRKALMWEPRGHYDMYGAILTAPVSPQADLGVIFMHNAGYSDMCGHGIIALVTGLLETHAIEPKGEETTITFDTPAGLVKAIGYYDKDSGKVTKVSFQNVPSFVYARDLTIKGRLLGQFNRLKVDIAFGGAFYAIVPIERLGIARLEDETLTRWIKLGASIKSATIAALKIEHPLEPALNELYGTILVGPPRDAAHHSANICIFADREADRSPTGTGVSARLALHHAKGELPMGQKITIESIIGSTFEGQALEQTRVGSFAAIVPEISGQAYITGRHEFMLDPNDDLGTGFLVH